MAPPSSIVSKLKVHLKLSVERLRIVQQKDQAIAKKQRRDMAQLLEQGKYESARIRVENIIRSDLTTELLEILELYCELLLARVGLMEPAACDPGLEEAVKAIIYAAPRTDVKELQQARKLLVEKYGKEFGRVAAENIDGKVPERVLKKLRLEPPSQELVESYLKAIAHTYDVSYGDDTDADEEEELNAQEEQGDGSNDDDDDDDEHPGSGGQAQKALEEPLAQEPSKPAPPRPAPVPRSPLSIAPPSPSTDNANPKIKLPGPPELKPTAKMKKQADASAKPPKGATDRGKSAGSEGKVVAAKPAAPDDLEARFAALTR